MATQTLPPAPKPATDDEARMRAFQITGSDLPYGAPGAFTGDWHESLKATAALWAKTGTDIPTAA